MLQISAKAEIQFVHSNKTHPMKPFPCVSPSTITLVVCVSLTATLFCEPLFGETLKDRIWIWGHPTGAYNTNFLKDLDRKSTITPVDAAKHMGIRNMIFVGYDGRPAPPYESYFKPFKKLRRVYWSLVAAGGTTSTNSRKAAISLANQNENIVGFILDDFFHAPKGCVVDSHWLANNRPEFPVLYTVHLEKPRTASGLELIQTDWKTGDYRAKNILIEVPHGEDSRWREIGRIMLPDHPGAIRSVSFPPTRLRTLRLRFLDTYDSQGAQSVGLLGFRLFSQSTPLSIDGATADASSTFPGFDPSAPLRSTPLKASLTPRELRALKSVPVQGKQLPMMAVLYTWQMHPRAAAHLGEVDQISMWTWNPDDLEHLRENFESLEQLAGDKSLWLGCYMFDFFRSRPIPVERMRHQVAIGHELLKQKRIDGLIFLATPNVDVGLEAVDWTREWIARHGDEPLPP